MEKTISQTKKEIKEYQRKLENIIEEGAEKEIIFERKSKELQGNKDINKVLKKKQLADEE